MSLSEPSSGPDSRVPPPGSVDAFLEAKLHWPRGARGLGRPAPPAGSVRPVDAAPGDPDRCPGRLREDDARVAVAGKRAW